MATESRIIVESGHTPERLRWSLIAGSFGFGLDLAEADAASVQVGN